MDMNAEYNGMRYSVSPRSLRNGGIVYDISVTDTRFRPVWSYTTTDNPERAITIAKRWIDGKDRSVGFTH